MASERNGIWGRAIEVPGLAALSAGGYSEVSSVSCASAGNCAAGGSYNRSICDQGFVAVERNGVWGRAIGVPGLGALSKGGAYVVSVSCASAGSCAAGGYYYADRGQNTPRGFVASERRGRWGTAIEVPGLAALNRGGYADVNSVSCASAGNCAAGGIYLDRRGWQGFVAAERHGRWGQAVKVPGLAALNAGGYAGVGSVSCASPGNCTAGGIYLDRRGWQGFVAAERHGRWGRASILLAGSRGDRNRGDCRPAAGVMSSDRRADRVDDEFGQFVAARGRSLCRTAPPANRPARQRDLRRQ